MAFGRRLQLLAAAEGPEALPLMSWTPGSVLCRFGIQEGLFCGTESLWLALCGWDCALALAVGAFRCGGVSGCVRTPPVSQGFWSCVRSGVTGFPEVCALPRGRISGGEHYYYYY